MTLFVSRAPPLARAIAPLPLLLALMNPPASADPIVGLSFNALEVGEDVLGFYAGGSGSLGSGPGPDFGIMFSPGMIASPPDVLDEPSGKSVEPAVGLIMDVRAGYEGTVSFYHYGLPGSVRFFNGPGGTGQEVFILSSTGWSTFWPVGASIPAFQSAVFELPSSRIDSLTFGAHVVPEASTLLLLGTGVLCLFGTGLIRKRR